VDNRTLIMTGAAGAAITGFCLGCGGPGSANLSAVLGVPISASALASVGLPTWLAWAEYMLRAIMVLFLSVAGYGLYRQRREALTMTSTKGGSQKRPFRGE